MNHHSLQAAIALCSLALLGSAPSAIAGTTIYPGSLCVRWSATDVVPSLSSGRIFNDSTTQTMRVDCPILHQDFGGVFANNDLDDADVGVIDAHTAQDASCYLRSVYQNGSNLYSYSGGTRTTTGFGSNEQNLDFDLANGNSETWYYIGCLIPPRQNGQSSGITYYRAAE